MKIFKNSPTNSLKILLILSLLFAHSCGPFKYKKTDIKDNPINDSDKRKKNIEEGRGIGFGKFTLGGGKGGKFDFASSNELWRATIEILDFTPLSNADYGGGIIITDWYSDNNNSRESIKISVQFLSNEIRADGLKVIVYKKICTENQNCKITSDNSKLNDEIKIAILKKAALIQKNNPNKKKAKKSITKF